MTFRTKLSVVILVIALVLPLNSHALTALEILDQVAKQNFGETFRISLVVKTFKGKKEGPEHVMWIMGRAKEDSADLFVQFDEPKDSKGLRFLFQVKSKQEPKAFMYLPATRKTVPLGMENPSVTLGGTGLTMEDIQGFIPKSGEKENLLKEETVEGRDCYVIQILLPDGNGERLLWVSKKDFLVIKSQHVDSQGNVKKTFRVVEFFKTEKGREFPREEEIVVPDKNTKIRLRQDNAVFGIEIPEELMDPEKFGTFSWQQ